MDAGNTPEKFSVPALEGRVVPPIGARAAEREADRLRRLELFVVETPRRRLADLIVPEATRRQLNTLLTKIRHHHTLYETFGLSEVDPYGGRTAINLYGPPGTGKSFAADALANELGLGIIRANYAEIESKYVGETAKNIKAAFEKARETGAVLFFDEADSILGRRLSNITQSTDHAVNVSRSVMLLELDRFSGVTIFATNLASNYDTAFVRRILGHVEMPLPDVGGRARLWRLHIPGRMPIALDEAGWDRLAAETEGLAGGDILNCVVSAASRAIERDGPDCQVTLADFLVAIAATRRAREVIGVAAPGGTATP
ncbi:MAG: ATP-binding protein [Anaerolineales bacterium]|nr:ATP-binding protein [Anaerolineales bacterium]